MSSSTPEWESFRVEPPPAKRQEAVARLREILTPGATVYALLRHVGKTGNWTISAYYTVSDNALVPLTGLMRDAMGKKWKDSFYGPGIRIAWIDYDVVLFRTVYQLGRLLYPNGGPGELSLRDVEYEHDGGYLLRCHYL